MSLTEENATSCRLAQDVNKVDETQTSSSDMSEEWHCTGRRVVRKLDMTLMPIIWILYLINYLDRNNIAYVHYLFVLRPRLHVRPCWLGALCADPLS